MYLQCALVLKDPVWAEAFGRAIAEHFQNDKIQLVASPAIGGIIIGYEVARALRASFLWTEREGGNMTLRRGFSVSPGERTLVVEDVLTTGASTRETIETLRCAGAEVIAAASIIDRSMGKGLVGIRLVSLAKVEALAVDASLCAACKRGEPTVKPGSKKDSTR